MSCLASHFVPRPLEDFLIKMSLKAANKMGLGSPPDVLKKRQNEVQKTA